ncbi:MAG TPA: NAD-dependent succinate-semialdehyde dehydrogenase [Vicinamibacterales bacterium]|nr:NAD-dependent succinate-semialdehyde dehydrogenase [Vicinamibacterales bacterium]
MQTANLIGQEWRAAESGLTVPVTDPATDEVIAEVPKGGAADARLAIEAARLALDDWRARPAAERSMLLRRLSDLMLARQEQLALLMTREQGKPLAEARGEILYAASFIEWAAEEAKRVYGDTIPASRRDKRILVLRQPVGVTAAITPWNFPSAMITRKLGPALAAGCTMVVKPATQTPLSAIAIGELALEAGIPPGVVNIVTGDARAIGDELLSNPTVRKLSFTGSTEVGKVLMTKAAQNVTRLSLELGGHAPFLVFDDANLDAAVAGALATKFRNTGQTCICANRFFVQDGIYDAFVARLGEAARKIRVGRGTEDGVQIGPLIDDAALEKVTAHVDDARAKGAKVVTGGAAADAGPGLSRRFYQPTVIEGFTDAMLISHEETFGPVAPVRRFRDEAEAIELANRSIYGLAAYFYTQDASRLMRVAEALEYGVIGANDGLPSTAQAPFGGMKQSGIGREGGKYVMDEYLEVKYISWGLTTS